MDWHSAPALFTETLSFNLTLNPTHRLVWLVFFYKLVISFQIKTPHFLNVRASILKIIANCSANGSLAGPFISEPIMLSKIPQVRSQQPPGYNWGILCYTVNVSLSWTRLSWYRLLFCGPTLYQFSKAGALFSPYFTPKFHVRSQRGLWVTPTVIVFQNHRPIHRANW